MTSDTELTVGSPHYYASVMSSTLHQPSIPSSLILLEALEKIIVDVTDPGVARLKIQWWQEQITLCGNQKNSDTQLHPLLKQSDFIKTDNIPLWHQYLNCLEQIILHKKPPNNIALITFSEQLSAPETLVFSQHPAARLLSISLSLGRIALSQNERVIDTFLDQTSVIEGRLEYLSLSQQYYQQACQQQDIDDTLCVGYILACCQQKQLKATQKKLLTNKEILVSLMPLHYYWLSRKAFRNISRQRMPAMVTF